jgi:hypothetical protein
VAELRVRVHEAGSLEEPSARDVGVDILEEIVDVTHAKTQEIVDGALAQHHA